MSRSRGRALVLLGALAALVSWSSADVAAQLPEVFPPVLVTAPPPLSSSSEQWIPGRDFELRPEGRPADVLRLVPGLVISQHQGGGKAEQYLIRGFDADHGTELVFVGDEGTTEAQGPSRREGIELGPKVQLAPARRAGGRRRRRPLHPRHPPLVPRRPRRPLLSRGASTQGPGASQLTAPAAYSRLSPCSARRSAGLRPVPPPPT